MPKLTLSDRERGPHSQIKESLQLPGLLIQLFALLSALHVAACSTSPTRYADDHMDRIGVPQFNAITRASTSEAQSFSKVPGSTEEPLERSDLVLVREFDADRSLIRIWKPNPKDATYAMPEFFTTDSEWRETLELAAETTLHEILDPLTELQSRMPTINIVVAPVGSGLWLREIFSLSAREEDTWLMVGYSDRDADRRSTTQLWNRIALRFAEHSMTLQKLLQRPDQEGKSRQVDSFTAISVYAACGSVRLLQNAINDGYLRLPLTPDYADVFPGLLDGSFNPITDSLLQRDARAAGRINAYAFIFHSFTGNDEKIDIDNPREVEPMLKYCEGLAHSVPEFSSGETDLNQPLP